jgi:uncharacterized protein YbjT (DUF2867 family)
MLVTGATGSLGSNVIAEAARRGLEVRALVRDPARVHGTDGVECRISVGCHGTPASTP